MTVCTQLRRAWVPGVFKRRRMLRVPASVISFRTRGLAGTSARVLGGTGASGDVQREWPSASESCHERGSGAPLAARCRPAAGREAGAVPRICRTVSPDAARGGSIRRTLGARDQVRRLPHAGPPANRAACHLHTAGLRLDAALPDVADALAALPTKDLATSERARGPGRVNAPVRPSWPGGPAAHPERRGRAYRRPRHR